MHYDLYILLDKRFDSPTGWNMNTLNFIKMTRDHTTAQKKEGVSDHLRKRLYKLQVISIIYKAKNFPWDQNREKSESFVEVFTQFSPYRNPWIIENIC